jgi:hypothetical protein
VNRLALCLLINSAALLFAACSSTPSADRGGAEDPSTGFHFAPTGGEASWLDPDAAVGARAEALFEGCAGGPETSCHASGAGTLRLNLGPAGDVVNVPAMERPDLLRVRPFYAEDSYLYLKVRGDGGIEGGRMPLDFDYDPRLVDLVHDWIEAGAPVP